MRVLVWLLLSVACAIGAAWEAAAQQPEGLRPERRVALVVGNSSYQRISPLPNPRNDAEDMVASLRRLGFEVIDGRDLDKRSMDRRLGDFARSAQGAEAALVFYAGHGLQHQGQNYLVPTDAKLEDEIDLDFETIRLEEVIRALDRASGARILILDACRNLPLPGRAGRSEGVALQGLAKLVSRKNLIVAYATQPNDVAYDGAGRNSFFTAALLKELQEPGLEVGQLFQRVQASVNQMTQGRQTPEVSRSFPGSFVLNRSESDQQIWARLRSSQDPGQLRSFIERFPNSFFVEDARARIVAIEQIATMQEANRRAAEEAKLLAEEGRRRQQEQLAALQAEEQRRSSEDQSRRERDRAALLAAEQDRQAWERLEQVQERRRAERQRLEDEERQIQERLRSEAARAERERQEAMERTLLEERRRAEQERVALEQRRLQDERDEAERRAGQERVAALEHQPAAFASLNGGSAGSETVPETKPAALAPRVPTALTNEIQDRLRRLGCLQGETEASWGERSKAALKAFYQHAAAHSPDPRFSATRSIASTDPDEVTLDLLREHKERVCPLVCPAGFRPQGDTCLRKTCPSGYRLSGDDCLPAPQRAVRPPVAKPSLASRPSVISRPPRATPRQVEAPQRVRPIPAAKPAAARRAREVPVARATPVPRVKARVQQARPIPVLHRPRAPVAARLAPSSPPAPAANFGAAHVGAVRAMTRF